MLTPDECTLFVNPDSLTESVRQYLHTNGVAVLEYDQIWSSLSTLNQSVSNLRSVRPLSDNEAGRIVSVQGLKIGKTDKVLIGTKTSWAIAKAIGEVSTRCSLIANTDNRTTWRSGGLALRRSKRRRMLYV